MQSVSAVQLVLHAVVEAQMYCPQVDVVGDGQLPLPEQKAGAVKVVPEQAGPLHITELLAWVQAPAPLQVPVLPQVPLAAQRACGSVTVLATLAQVPGLPATLQAMQVPQLAVLQQTPSTQFPLPHSWFERQATPSDLTGRQLPLVPVQ